MTKAEKDRRITELKERKQALTWRYIGACMELNAQISTLRATSTEGESDESSTEDQTATDSEDENGRYENVLRSR